MIASASYLGHHHTGHNCVGHDYIGAAEDEHDPDCVLPADRCAEEAVQQVPAHAAGDVAGR